MYDRATWAIGVIESRTLVPRDPHERAELLAALNVLRPAEPESANVE